MNKIVLDLKLENLKENDIIIYDKKENSWFNINKSAFLGETSKQIKELKNANLKLNQEIEKLKEQVSELAKLILEDLN